eukprot:scaffold21867_cov89-Skeletonema_dohrnii-CCMP3373.AAC.1
MQNSSAATSPLNSKNTTILARGSGKLRASWLWWVGWMDRGGVALECFVLQMTAALILHYELLQGGSTPFEPICLVFVAPSWS